MKAWLDLARLLFALVVVVDHAVILFLLPDDVFGARLWFPWLNAAAAVAVSGFFLISGFAIAHSVTPLDDHFSLRRFFANRAGRIYPPLLLACALGLALVYFWIPAAELAGMETSFKSTGGVGHYIAAGVQGSTWQMAGATLLMLSDPVIDDRAAWSILAPAWTLPFEILMYLVAGLSFRLFQSPRQLMWAAGILLWCLLWSWALVIQNAHVWVLLGLWSIGFAIGLLTRQHWSFGLLAKIFLCVLPSIFFLDIVVSAFGPISLANASTMVTKLGSPYVDSWHLTVGIALIIFSIFYALGLASRALARLMKQQRSFKVPDFSYTLYICHFPLLLGWGTATTRWEILTIFPGWAVNLFGVISVILVCGAMSLIAERKRFYAKIISFFLYNPWHARLKSRSS